jgi:hypothetical protein
VNASDDSVRGPTDVAVGASPGPSPQPSHRVALHGGWSVWRTFAVRGAGFPAETLLALASPRVATAADRILEQGATPTKAAVDEFDGVFEEESKRLFEVLRSLASNPRFREALTWQNRNVLKTGLDPFLRSTPESLDQGKHRDRDRARRHMGLVARYVQRYGAKNDQIGFFGPMGWGRFDPAGPPVSLRVGPGLLARRAVYFEHWAVDAVATKLASDPAMRPWLAPRKMPTLRIEGSTLWSGAGAAREVPRGIARLLAECDGERSAREIAQGLIADPTLNLRGEEEVYALLGELADRGMVLWTLEVPTSVSDPEVRLRKELEKIGDDVLRSRGLAVLDSLDARKTAVAQAAGNATALEKALEELDSAFRDFTGREPTRRAGETYAARTLVYEDCVRDLDLTLGQPVLDRLGPPLELVLQSARWFTAEVAARYERAFLDLYEELARRADSSVVDFLSFWWRSAAHFGVDAVNNVPAIVQQVVDQLQQRWARILRLSSSERVVVRSAESIRGEVLDAFAARAPGWPQARYHGPDVLPAARSAEALAGDDCLWVLGEVHLAWPTMGAVSDVAEHPSPDEIARAREVDVPQACAMFVAPKEEQMRTKPWTGDRLDVDVELGQARSPRPRNRVIAAADLVVDKVNGRLLVRRRDGSRSFDWLAFYGFRFSDVIVSHFRPLPPDLHRPRVLIDKLVVARETWTVETAEMLGGVSKVRAERFLAVRRWAHTHGMPRFVFVKVPSEMKAIYVDFDSPIYVDELVGLARRSEKMTVSEMLPSFDQLWLSDADGGRYTSELRLGALDPIGWSR